eukprot:TRINITY_DN10459_c0_g1_i1.p1 TRINITY_DN10459_c0_g1~~TRINITY_DN10459_c0_g1_i1.p1  ORF type:complete len:1291 (-),score=230.40 TRINITY_DN10459_c0_g1_i1:3-3875(-)
MESEDATATDQLTLETLPVDVITVVFNFLNADDIFTAVCVSRNVRARVLSSQNTFKDPIQWWHPSNPAEAGVLRFGCLGQCHNLRSLNLEQTFVFASKYKQRNFWRRPNAAINADPAEDHFSMSRSGFDPTRRIALDTFKSLTRLEDLNLSYNPALGEEHIQAIKAAQLTRLTSLNLSCSGHKRNADPIQLDTLSSCLAELTNLKTLFLHKIALTGQAYKVDASEWEDDEDEEQEASSDGEEGIGFANPLVQVRPSDILPTLQTLKKLEVISLPSFIDDWAPLKDLPALKKLILSDASAKMAIQELIRGIPMVQVLETTPSHLGWYLERMEGMTATIFVAQERGSPESFLHAACSAKTDTGIVSHLLDLNDKIKCFGANALDFEERTPLMVTRTTTVARKLLDAGADVNATSLAASKTLGERRIWTPLMSAVSTGNDELVSLLISRGASLLQGSPSPLLLAAKHSRPKIRDLVLSYAPGILIDMKQSDLFALLLQLFTNSTPVNVLMTMLDLINQDQVAEFAKYCDSYRRSALHWLCARYKLGSESVIQRLLDAGADPSLRDSSGLSPLWYIIQYAFHDTVSMVLSYTKLTPETDCRGVEKRSCLGLLLRKGHRDLFLNAVSNFTADHLVRDPTPVAYDICRRCSPEEVSQVLSAVGPIDFNCLTNEVLNLDGAGKYPIFGALASEHEMMLPLLLDHKADPNVSNQFGIPALMMSYSGANICDLRKFHLLLGAGANTNCIALPRTSSVVTATQLGQGSKPIPTDQIAMLNQTALTYAISRSNVEVVKSLLAHGAHPDARNAVGFTPLTCLLSTTSGVKMEVVADILDLLLQHKVDVNLPDEKDTTPLAALMRMDRNAVPNKKDLFLKLFDAGAQPTSWKRYESFGRVVAENMSPNVMEAAISWNLDIKYLEKILDAAPELIEQPTSDGRTLLSMAVAGVYSRSPNLPRFLSDSVGPREEDQQLLNFLLERGADIRQKDRNGNTVMEHCINFRNKGLAEILVQHDRLKNKDRKDSDPTFVDLVDAECTTDDMTPLVRAADLSYEDFVNFLLDQGANVNLNSGSSFALDHVTPLHIAVISESPKIVDILVKRGADVQAKSRNRTALAEALNRSRINDEIVHILVEAGSERAGLSDVQLKLLDAALARWEKRSQIFSFETSKPQFSFGSGTSSPLPKPDLSPFTSTFSSAAGPFGATSPSTSTAASSPFGTVPTPFTASPNAFASPSPSTAASPFGMGATPPPTSPNAFASPFGTFAQLVIPANPFAAVVAAAPSNPFQSAAAPKSDVVNPFQ